MADKKITELPNINGADLVDADEFVVVDISADETKAITLAELKNAFDAGTGFVRVTGDTMTGVLVMPDGTNSAPSISNTGDTNTGMFFGAADTVSFTAGGTKRLDINTTGIDVTGNMVVSGTVDGVDVATRDGVLTSTTTTANAALPKAGGAVTGNVTFGDSDKAIFGAGSDLQIYHDGAHSYIQDAGLGELRIKTNGTIIQFLDNSNNYLIRATVGADVGLYHNTAQKLATTTTGIDVTGTVTADGLSVGSTSEAAGLFTGYSSITDGDYVNNGEIRLGNNVAFQGRISYEGQTTGILYIENSYNNNAADIVFRSKSVGTAQNKLLIEGNGNISFYEDTGTTAKLFWDASAESLGIGTSSMDGTLHVHTASAGTVTASPQADDLVVESNTEAGITILSPDDQSARIRFSSPSTNTDVGGASIFYRQNINKMSIGTAVAGGVLALNSGANVAAMTLDANQNVGIGVVPESWLSSYTALQIGDAGNVVGSTDNSFFAVGANAYLDSTNSRYEYINTDYATQYYQVDGTHVWRTAASGSANAAITWSESMRIDASGNVGIGIVPPTNSINSKLNVQHALTAAYSGSSFNGSTVLRLNNNNVVNNYVGIGFTHEGGTEGFLGWVRRGLADVADFVFQGYDGSVNGYKELARINNTGMTSTQSIGYSLNSLIEPTAVSTSKTGTSGGDCFFDYVLDSYNISWSTFNIFLTVSTISGGAVGDAGAWYMIAGRHYNGSMSASVRDSGGNTGSFTVAVSNQGGTDPLNVRLAITGMQGTSVATATLSNVYGVVSVS